MGNDKYKAMLVDDSPDDLFFMRLALERSPKFVIVDEARDGQEAMEHLQRESILPDILLLDLKMPRKNGFDVLQWIQTKNLGHLTVAVLSGSWLAEDIARSLELGAHAYFKKSSIKEEQQKMIFDLEKLLEARANPPH